MEEMNDEDDSLTVAEDLALGASMLLEGTWPETGCLDDVPIESRAELATANALASIARSLVLVVKRLDELIARGSPPPRREAVP